MDDYRLYSTSLESTIYTRTVCVVCELRGQRGQKLAKKIPLKRKSQKKKEENTVKKELNLPIIHHLHFKVGEVCVFIGSRLNGGALLGRTQHSTLNSRERAMAQPMWAESPELRNSLRKGTRMRSRSRPQSAASGMKDRRDGSLSSLSNNYAQNDDYSIVARAGAAAKAKKRPSSSTGAGRRRGRNLKGASLRPKDSLVRRKTRKRVKNAAIQRSTNFNVYTSSSDSKSRPKSAGPVRALRYSNKVNSKSSVPVGALHDMIQGTENRRNGATVKRRARPSTAQGVRGRNKNSTAVSKSRPQSAAAGKANYSNNSLRNSAPTSSISRSLKRQRRPLSHSSASNRGGVQSNVRTSFPPVSSQSGQSRNALGINGWMDTSKTEKIPVYNALEDRYCPMYKPKNLVRGRQVDKSSPKYKMAQWRKKYNSDLKKSLAERKEQIQLQRGVQQDKALQSASYQASTTSLRAEDSFPFPENTGQIDSIMEPEHYSESLGATNKLVSSTTNITYAQNVLADEERIIDTPTRNQLRAKGAAVSSKTAEQKDGDRRGRPWRKKQSGRRDKHVVGNANPSDGGAPFKSITYEDGGGTLGKATSHNQDEVQVVKSILHRERLVQLCRAAVSSMDSLERIHALLDRVRLATVETVEAVQRWNAGEERKLADKGGRRSHSFKWHAKNYLIDLCSDLDSLHFASSTLCESVGFDLRRNPFLLPGLPAVDDTSLTMLAVAMKRRKDANHGETNQSLYKPGNHHDIDIKRVLAAETALLREEELVYEDGKNRGRMAPEFLIDMHRHSAVENSLRRAIAAEEERVENRVARHYAKKGKKRRRKEKKHSMRMQASAHASDEEASEAAQLQNSPSTKNRYTKRAKRSPKKRRKRRTDGKKTKHGKKKRKQGNKVDPRPWRIKRKDPPDPDVANRLHQEGLKQWERIFGLNKPKPENPVAASSKSDVSQSGFSSSSEFSDSDSDSSEYSSGSSEDSSDHANEDDLEPSKRNSRQHHSSPNMSSKNDASPPTSTDIAKRRTPPPGTPISSRLQVAEDPSHRDASQLGRLSEWERYYDDDEGTFYFHNATLGRSSWARPHGWKTPARGSKAPLPIVPRDDKTDWTSLKGKSPAKQKRGIWTEHVDLETGAYWYWNSKTGESTWETPLEWGDVEDEYGRKEGTAAESDEKPSETFVSMDGTGTNLPVLSPPQGTEHPNDENTNWEEVKMSSPVHRQRGQWTQHFDNRNNAYWYEHFDENTGKVTCTWDMPEEWLSSATQSSHSEVTSKEYVCENLDTITDWESVRARSPAKRRHSAWTEHFDQESGAFWYHNDETNESTWEQPAGWNGAWESTMASHQDSAKDWDDLRHNSSKNRQVRNWVEYLDKETDAYWYYNVSTNESSWNQPEEFYEAYENEKKGGALRENDTSNFAEEAVELVNSDEDWKNLKATSPIKRKCGAWSEYFDSTSGNFWYHNNATGESQWERPQAWNDQLPETDADTDWNDLKAQSPVHSKRGAWTEHYDNESGAYWYRNEDTGASTWNPPAEWQEHTTQENTEILKMTHEELKYWKGVRETSEVNRELDEYWTEWKDKGDTQSLWYSRSRRPMDREDFIECTWNMPDLAKSADIDGSEKSSESEEAEQVAPAHLNTDWSELRESSPLKQRRSSIDKQFDWSEHLDESSGAYWYYNNRTGESTWDQPERWAVYGKQEDPQLSALAIDNTNVKRGQLLEGLIDETSKSKDRENRNGNKFLNDASTNWEEVAAHSPLRRVVGFWEEHFDPASGYYWYYNTKTKESTWQQPENWIDVASKFETSSNEKGLEAGDQSTGDERLPNGWPQVSGDNNKTDWNVVGFVSPAENHGEAGNSLAWHKMLDPVTKCPWWYNNITGEKTWHEPPDWQDHVARSTAKKKKRDLHHSQRKKKRTRNRLKQLRHHNANFEDSNIDDYGSDSFENDEVDWDEMMNQSPVPTRTIGKWEEHIEKKTGHTWWYNTETHISSWEIPEFVQKRLCENQFQVKIAKAGEKKHHRLAETKTTTPKKVKAESAAFDDITMSPAYKNLLADVKSLRESLKVAESELHVLSQKTPVKPNSASEKDTPRISPEQISNDAVALAQADVRAQKVASEVARIEARLERVKAREKSFLEKIEGVGDVGHRANREKHMQEKRKKKKNKKHKKHKKDRNNHEELDPNKTSRIDKDSKLAGSPVTPSKYRSERATQSIARAMAAVEFASSPHAADAYSKYAAKGSTSKPRLHEKNAEQSNIESHDDDTPRFRSVHKLCNDAISFASSLRFGDHMDAPMNFSDSNTDSIVRAARAQTEEVSYISQQVEKSHGWKEEARGNALAQISKKIAKHEAKKVNGHYERIQKKQKIKSEAKDQSEGHSEAEMIDKLQALQKEMIKTAQLIASNRSARNEGANEGVSPALHVANEYDEERRYQRYAAAVTIQTQWRGLSSRQYVSNLMEATKHQRIPYESMVTHGKHINAAGNVDTFSDTWFKHRESLNRKLEESAAIKVQAQVRRRLASSNILEKRLERREMRLARLKYVSARMIQSLFRAYYQRTHFLVLKQSKLKPIVTIQAEWRRHAAMRLYQAEQHAQAKEIEQAGILAARERENSAMRLQCLYRGHLSRRMISVEQEAANDLQRVWRGNRGRLHTLQLIEENGAATSVQSQWRRKCQQDEYRKQLMSRKQEKSAILLQSHARASLARRKVSRRMKASQYQLEVNAAAQQNAAIVIQSAFRGQQKRSLYEDVLKGNHACATRLQSLYRGHLSRRLLTIYFVAAIRIQRFWKSKLLQLKWRRRALDVISLLRAEKLLATELAESSLPKSNTDLMGGGQLIRRAVDEDGNNALLLAARAGSIRIVRICLTKGYDPTSQNTSEKQTALHLAAGSAGQRTEIASMLIRAGADISALDSLGRSVAHVAAASGNDGVLQMLCDRGVPLEITDQVAGGRTPLHCAAYFGRSRCCEILLYAGSSVHVRSTTGGTTPLHTAAARGSTNVVHLLAEVCIVSLALSFF